MMIKQHSNGATLSVEQPRKLFYRINEVAKLTGLKPYVLRYWETEFPELSPEKDASDQRRYRQRDIETVQAIRKLLYEERFTIKGARQRLKIELRRNGNGKQAEPVEAPEVKKPSLARSAKPLPVRQPSMGETLYHLRSEVNDLLKMLGA